MLHYKGLFIHIALSSYCMWMILAQNTSTLDSRLRENCDGKRYGYELNLTTCREAIERINPPNDPDDDLAMYYGSRSERYEGGWHNKLPMRYLSCKSRLPPSAVTSHSCCLKVLDLLARATIIRRS